MNAGIHLSGNGEVRGRTPPRYLHGRPVDSLPLVCGFNRRKYFRAPRFAARAHVSDGHEQGHDGPGRLVITDLRGRKLAGRREASSELAMHLLIYNRRPEVHAVVHAHPPPPQRMQLRESLSIKPCSANSLLRSAVSRSLNTARPARRSFPMRSSRWFSITTRFFWLITAW